MVDPAAIRTESSDVFPSIVEENSWKNTKDQHPDATNKLRSIGLFALSLLTISTTSGVVFGWPALRRELIKSNSDVDEKSLSLIYISGAWATQGSRLFWGIIRDRFGSRYTSTASVLICAAGAAAMSVAQTIPGLAAALFLMGCGSGVQLTLQPVANLFETQGWVISTFSGGFQVSVLLFLIVTTISSDRRVAFGGFATFLTVLSIVVCIFIPNSFQREMSAKEKSDKSNESLGSGFKNAMTENQENRHAEELESKSLWVQLRSVEYILLVVWLSVLLVPMQFYIGTIGYQLEQRGDNDGKFSRTFAPLYAASAIAGPPLGYFSDRFGVSAGKGLASVFLAISFFTLASRRLSLAAHTAGMLCYGVGRMAAYAMYFTNVGKRFGFDSFGTLSGLGLLVSAIVSLLQYPLIAIATAEETDKVGMANDSLTDIVCGCVMFVPVPYYFWLYIQEQPK